MRNPRRWRNIALAVFVSGIVIVTIPFLLPDEEAFNTVHYVILICGATAIPISGAFAYFNHAAMRAKESLARGEDIIARWRVDAATWRAFIAHNYNLGAESGLLNELSLAIRDEVPAGGIEVIVGKEAIEVDGSIYPLPRRGTPAITHAELNISRVRPSFIELHLYYPGGGTGASGVPRAPTCTALRFPVAADALRDADRVVAHFRGDLPGEPDFFHGRGDGSDPEDLSRCHNCGYETHKYVFRCPQCGSGGMRSKRWVRRLGGMLVVCGLIITGIIGVVSYYTMPLMLRPGVGFNGTRFSGTSGQLTFVLGIFALVGTFGLIALIQGLWQVKTGRFDKRPIYAMIAIAGSLLLIAMLL